MPISAPSQTRTVAAGGTVYAGAYPAVPLWVPAPGDTAVLTNTSGHLTNHFRDVCAGINGFVAAYSVKILQDYRGGRINPHFGAYGALQVHGGGHSSTDNNGLYGLVFDTSTLTWRRHLNPSDIDALSGGASTGNTDTYNVTSITDATWGELADGRPLSPHTWGVLLLIPPSLGGAACGSLLQVVIPAAGAIGLNFKAAHRFDFNSTTDGDVTVSRASATGGTLSSAYAAPVLCGLGRDPLRAFIFPNATAMNMQWLDLDSEAYQVSASNAPFDVDGSDSAGVGYDASATIIEIPERGLLVMAQRRGGVLRLDWADVSVADPQVGGTATLSASVALPALEWSAACWCSDNGRIIVGGLADGDVAEITVPATLTNTWTVTVVSPPSGGLDTGEAGLGYSNTRGLFDYNPRTKCITLPFVGTSGDDQVRVYRPTGT